MRFANGLIREIPETLRRVIELQLRLQRPNEHLSDRESSQLDELQRAIEERNRELEKENQELKKENKKMRWLYLLLALVAIAAIAGIVYAVERSGNDTEGPAICDDAKPAGEFSTADVGETVEAKGEVAEVSRPETGTPRVYLNLDDEYPDQELAVVIWGDKIKNWNTPPEDKYDNREIAVSGELDEYRGDLQIAANSPNDVVICP